MGAKLRETSAGLATTKSSQFWLPST